MFKENKPPQSFVLDSFSNNQSANFQKASNSQTTLKRLLLLGFPGGAVVKNPPANAGDTGSSPGPGRSHMPRSN